MQSEAIQTFWEKVLCRFGIRSISGLFSLFPNLWFPPFQEVSSLIHSFSGNPRLWTLTLQSIKITILCLSSSPLLWKKWMVLSEKQLYTCGTHSISLLSRNGFFQFLSTFGCSPISPNTFKKCVLLLLAGYSTVWYKQLCHYLKLEFYNQAWSQ